MVAGGRLVMELKYKPFGSRTGVFFFLLYHEPNGKEPGGRGQDKGFWKPHSRRRF